jgi:hypothetical protein
MRTLQNRSADLFAELCQVRAVANASQVAKSFVDTVNFDAWAHFLKRRHYPVRHISVQLVVAAEANNASATEKLLCLKNGSPMVIPAALASALRAITQPSLFERTTTGRPLRSGLNTVSHDA